MAVTGRKVLWPFNRDPSSKWGFYKYPALTALKWRSQRQNEYLATREKLNSFSLAFLLSFQKLFFHLNKQIRHSLKFKGLYNERSCCSWWISLMFKKKAKKMQNKLSPLVIWEIDHWWHWLLFHLWEVRKKCIQEEYTSLQVLLVGGSEPCLLFFWEHVYAPWNSSCLIFFISKLKTEAQIYWEQTPDNLHL